MPAINPYLCPYADPALNEYEALQGKQCLAKQHLVFISH